MNKKLMSFIRVILLIIIFVCLGILGRRGYDYWVNMKNNQYINDLVKEESKKEKKPSKKQSDEEKWKAKEKKYMNVLSKLREKNSDVKAFMEIEGTYISYPILQAEDNSFYLRKGLNKDYDVAGSIFMDYNNEADFSDDNTVIYGHHLEIDTMFTGLDNYRKEDFAKKHRKIFITTPEGLREYKVFSAYGTPGDADYRTLDFEDGKVRVLYFDMLKERSEVKLNTKDFTEKDSIITLSTCQYDYDDQRLAVHAVRVK